MTALGDILRGCLAARDPVILVSLAAASGSTPREAGARMLVGADRLAGTIGGGRLEFEAISAARRLIAAGAAVDEMDIPLGPAIGQCCGGHVTVRLERADHETLDRLIRLERQEHEVLPRVFLFGAGHVGKAIAAALAPLPLALSWIDSRAEEFPLDVADTITRMVAADPVARVSNAPPGSGFLVVTHSHALDFALAEAALRRGDTAYCGLIGSATKRSRFERWYRARGGRPGDLQRLVCPIGAGLDRDKRPPVIAAMVAAELLVALDRAARRVVPLDASRMQA
jgi:xanthine dehydrogenase accessory protein XdhC